MKVYSALVVLLLAASSLSAQSVIDYRVELGGDNHTADWENNQYTAFTAGNEADTQTFYQGTVLTWDVYVMVSGIHVTSPSGKPGDGYAPNGAAALAFDLELHSGTVGGPLVQIGRATVSSNQPSNGGWFSTINDGDADGLRGQNSGADQLQNAAFAQVFHIGNNGPSTGPGRVTDVKTSGGPKMDFSSFPSASGYPVNSTAPLGTLKGMGAAYPQFVASTNTAGVGMTGTTGGGCSGLVNPPLFEGQISTIGLAAGTYVLKLNPQAGNILRGDFDCATQSPNNFAVLANTINGDTITFTIAAPPAPVITAAQSIKTHAGTDRGIDLGISPAIGSSECRSGGPTRIDVTFANPIVPQDGSWTPGGEITATSNPVASITISSIVVVSSKILRFNLSGVSDRSCLSILLHGIAADTGGGVAGAVMTDTTLKQRVLLGDVTSNGKVTSADVVQAKAATGSATAVTFRSDLNADGTIGSPDINLIKSKTSSTVPTCP